MNFVEHVWERIRSGQINNYPNPVALNMGLAYTVQLSDRRTSLVWLPYEYTGIAYVDMGQQVNVHPYYLGAVIEELEISRGTDLHKPKTEEDFMKALHMKSWELYQLLQGEKYRHLQGSPADYLFKMYQFTDWLRYYTSAVTIGAGGKTAHCASGL